VPHDDNALDRLVRAMYRIQEWDRPLTVAPVLTEYFGRLSHAGVYKGAATVEALKLAAEKDPRIRALLSNTISATTATSGIKHNVIPARAEATLDIRLLPGVKPEDFEAELAKVIDDPKVTIEHVHVGWSDTNTHDTELFRMMEDVIHEHVEDAVVVPGMTVGFTDSSVLRNRGMISYGFSGGMTTPEIARGVHGHNERVSLESFQLNCQMVWELTRRMCSA
jgi:acetylornithine deacetylase/succinyl-diaminopimelate desuccinylase-like protein